MEEEWSILNKYLIKIVMVMNSILISNQLLNLKIK